MSDKEIPKRGEKKPLSKKTFSLDDFKKKMNIDDTTIKDKPLRFIRLSEAFKESTGNDIPLSSFILFRGYSNTGKSTALYETAVACQREGIIPIIIDTENSFKTDHLKLLGFNFEKDYIIIDNEYLLETYGKKWNKNTNQASIEDVAEFCHNILDMQENGELESDICFLWDSIGTLDCRRSITAQEKDKEANNMWNAGAMEQSFKSLWNFRIPNTGKANKNYTATFVGVQKVWFDGMSGAGVIKHKGGEAAFYSAREIYHLGGIQSHSTKKLTAVKNKNAVNFGTITKISVVKNHITGVAYDGKTIISTPHGFVKDDKNSIEEYKKTHMDYLCSILDDFSEGDVKLIEEESGNIVDLE